MSERTQDLEGLDRRTPEAVAPRNHEPDAAPSTRYIATTEPEEARDE